MFGKFLTDDQNKLVQVKYLHSHLLTLLFIFVGIFQTNNGILRKYWTQVTLCTRGERIVQKSNTNMHLE